VDRCLPLPCQSLAWFRRQGLGFKRWTTPWCRCWPWDSFLWVCGLCCLKGFKDTYSYVISVFHGILAIYFISRKIFPWCQLDVGSKQRRSLLVHRRSEKLRGSSWKFFPADCWQNVCRYEGHEVSAYWRLYGFWRSISDNPHRKDVIRGALTDGRSWIFIIVEAKESGAIFYQTVPIHLVHHSDVATTSLSKNQCDLVAGIIAHWVSLLPNATFFLITIYVMCALGWQFSL